MTTDDILKEKVSNIIDINFNNNISISVLGQEVTLKGIVKSYDEKDEIEEITWNTFGVVSVNNELAIDNEN
ncbi:BON domain-containing protein [Flavobacterium sp.]|jgi:osmotically-inducible protein OsmY|uniref:BON domain-containing protein n=1 Tax=Flavobacterium sp. TaxID=239 RepID=UPI0037528C02